MQKFYSILKEHNHQTSCPPIPGQSSFFKPVIQPRLAINQPNDIYEQEADAIADNVMRMTDEESMQQSFFNPAFSSIQRKCEHCEEEEKKLQRKETGKEEGSAVHGIENYIGHLNNSGQPLAATVRNFYEPRFGYDFSHVRVHTDSVAAKSAQSINAIAYTSGNNIVFNNGQFSPGTDSGKRLLGHELTHVVQQSGMGQRKQCKTSEGEKSKTQQHQVMKIQMENHPLSDRAIPVIQRAKICSKRLEAPVLGWIFNHAYIDDTGRNDCLGSGMAGNYAIQNLVSGNFRRGCAAKTDHSTDPQSYKPNSKPCDPKPGVTDVSACLQNAFNAYADPSVYANPSGPNSNTFAATLASACCADSSSSGLGLVPGWSHSPAPPCPLMVAEQHCEPAYLGGGAYLGEDCIVRQGAGPKM